MERVRSKLRPEEEQHAVIEGPTSYRTEQNKYEVACGMCGKLFYTDKATFERINYATQAGLDNPFKCEGCEQEYDELAYEG